MRLDGATAVVIGGTGVLGGCIAGELMGRGADVALVTRSDRDAHGLGALARTHADVRDRVALRDALVDLGGSFDVVVNATGVVAFGGVADVPPVVVEELMATNAGGTINVLALAGGVVREGGVVVNLTGVAAEVAVLSMSAYCASKSAARAATAVGARELRRAKIRVLDARPPHTETGLVGRALFGVAPSMPEGLDPRAVATRIVSALVDDEADLPASAFS